MSVSVEFSHGAVLDSDGHLRGGTGRAASIDIRGKEMMEF